MRRRLREAEERALASEQRTTCELVSARAEADAYQRQLTTLRGRFGGYGPSGALSPTQAEAPTLTRASFAPPFSVAAAGVSCCSGGGSCSTGVCHSAPSSQVSYGGSMQIAPLQPEFAAPPMPVVVATLASMCSRTGLPVHAGSPPATPQPSPRHVARPLVQGSGTFFPGRCTMQQGVPVPLPSLAPLAMGSMPRTYAPSTQHQSLLASPRRSPLMAQLSPRISTAQHMLLR